MVALRQLRMVDLARQKRVEVDLSGEGELTPSHTVGQAIDHFRERSQIQDSGVRWSAFSRGISLDAKLRLGDLHETQDEWTVMPEVSAG